MRGRPDGRHIQQALDAFPRMDVPPMYHIRRENDLVGSLGHAEDIAETTIIPDHVRVAGTAASDHFLKNHGINPMRKHLHQ